MKVLKVTKAILAFVIVLIGFYLIFAFIAWDIKWMENGSWFFRLLFLITGFPTSIAIAISMYDDELLY